MSNYPFSSLAALLLKAQHELREALQPHETPFNLNLLLGPVKDPRQFSVTRSRDGTAVLTVTEGARKYDLKLTAATEQAGPKAVLTLTDDKGQRTEHHFVNAASLTAHLPKEWQALHESVQDYLRRILGPSYEAILSARRARPEATQTETANSAADPAAPASEACDTQEQGPGRAESQKAVAELLTVTVRREGQRDLRFKGVALADARSGLRNGRQIAYRVFRTEAGKIVAIKEGLSMWLCEHDRAEVQVYDKLDEVAAFFGYNGLAKHLYAQLGLEQALVEELA